MNLYLYDTSRAQHNHRYFESETIQHIMNQHLPLYVETLSKKTSHDSSNTTTRLIIVRLFQIIPHTVT